MKPNEKIILSMAKRLENREEGIEQHKLQEIKKDVEQVRKKEAELSRLLSEEKARNQLQQLEVERRQKQLEASTDMIRKLQEDLENAQKRARSMSFELRDNEAKTKYEAEILQQKAHITGIEARLQRKQIELESAHQLVRDGAESSRRQLEEMRELLRVKENEVRELKEKEKGLCQKEATCSNQSREYLDTINQRVGSLEAKNESFKGKVDMLKTENQELQEKLKLSEEDKKSLQVQIDTLRGQLSQSEGSTNRVYSTLCDDLKKIKEDKATLRVEHLQLKKKCLALENENKELRERIPSQKETEEMRRKMEELEKENNKLKKENGTTKDRLEDMDKQCKEKLAQMERQMRENEACESAQIKLLNSELEVQRRKYDSTKKTVEELDDQCEKLMNKLRMTDSERKTFMAENKMLKQQFEEMRKQFTDKFKLQNENQGLKDRNKLLENKVTYLERELKETCTDHRDELAKLSDQLVGTTHPSSSAITSSKATTAEGDEKSDSRHRQQESQLRALERQLEQCRKENASLTEEMAESRKRELAVINENTLLRQNFAECLKKAEDFRDQLKPLNEANAQLKADLDKSKEQMTSLEDQIFELRGEMGQKDKLVAYLQSVVQPRQMQKLPKTRCSLLSSDSDFLQEIESEYKQCQQLERRKNELKMDLESRRKILADKQNENESLPLLREPFNKQPSKSTLATAPLTHSSTASSVGSNTPRVPGKMRHDIPHRWKRTFITVNSNSCRVCLEGLPYFRHVYRCRDCAMTVHQHCRPAVVNTCGLPSECADFYLDTHSTSTEQMTGWVKLLNLPAKGDRPADKWRNTWATIQDHKLAFFETDHLALNNGVPFMSIDLDKEHWRIYNQTAEKPLNGVRNEDMSVLIELRLPNCTLLMMAPTVQAKQRWVQALQYATNRRIFIQRRPSSAIVGNSLLLAMEAPQNLSIYCTQILRGEWLLIGAQEGLFATSMQQQQLRAPFQIAGVSKVFWMELLPEFDMLLIICGSIRRLMVVHLHQLNRAFKAEQQPSINLTSVSNIEQCHIAVISKPEHNREKRFVYLATVDSIIILQYITKLGVFSPVKQFKTEEPCMCICSTPIGFIFGADNFHFVKFDNDFSSTSQLMVENCPFDIPVATVEIADNEYLLAFHNYGLFVDSQGKRTRSKNVEWEKAPMEFVYTTPYLYIVYCEFLEVVRVAPLVGYESGTLTDDRNMFKCRSAHCTGFGLQPSEVLFVVSSDDRVELHSFNRHLEAAEQQGMKSILKRKLNEQPGAQSVGIKKKH